MGEPSIPFHLRSLDAKAAGELLGYPPRYVTERLACLPDFPKRVDRDGRPRWIAGELLEWREANRASRSGRRRRPCSKSKGFSGHDAR